MSRKGGHFLLTDQLLKGKRNSNNVLLKYVVDNSDISILSQSSVYGFIYKLKLKEGIKSPFNKFDWLNEPECNLPTSYSNSSNCLKEVRVFILKLSFINDSYSQDIYDKENKYRKTTVTSTEFERESLLQYEIYDETFDMVNELVPACIQPAYFGRRINLEGKSDSVYTKLAGLSGGNVLPTLKNPPNTFAFLLMEFADGYDTLHTIQEDTVKYTADQNGIAVMLYKAAHLLLYKAGYVHGDHHFGNIMIKVADNLEDSKVLLIDFGRTIKVAKSEKEKNLDIANPANYNEIFKYIISVAEKACACKHEPYNKINSPGLNAVDIYVPTYLERRSRQSEILKQNLLGFSQNSEDEFIKGFSSKPTFKKYNELRLSKLAPQGATPASVPVKAVVQVKVRNPEYREKIVFRAEELVGTRLPQAQLQKEKEPNFTSDERAYLDKLNIVVSNFLGREPGDLTADILLARLSSAAAIEKRIAAPQKIARLKLYGLTEYRKGNPNLAGKRLDKIIADLMTKYVPVGARVGGKRKTRRRHRS